MSVNGINNFAGAPTLLDYMDTPEEGFEPTRLAAADKAKTPPKATSSSKKNAYSTGGLFSEHGQATLKRALQEMQGKAGGKVTFTKIAAHQKDLETEFTLSTRIALAEKGVDLDTPFTLTLDGEGKINVDCNDALAKETIEKYLKDNPKVIEQFSYIQSLANLDRARQSSAIQGWPQMKDMKATLQSEAIETFFNAALQSNMGYSPLMANFAEGAQNANFYSGLRYKV